MVEPGFTLSLTKDSFILPVCSVGSFMTSSQIGQDEGSVCSSKLFLPLSSPSDLGYGLPWYGFYGVMFSILNALAWREAKSLLQLYTHNFFTNQAEWNTLQCSYLPAELCMNDLKLVPPEY